MVFFKRCILSLLVVLLCTGAANVSNGQETNGISTLVERKTPTCDPDSAYKQALTVRRNTKYAPFMTFVEKFNLEGELKKLTRGKAFFLPSVSTLQLKFKSMGLEKNYGTLDFTKYKLGPHRRSQFLRWVQLRLVRSRDTFAKMLDKQAGLKLGDCQFVEGASLLKNNQIFVDRPSNCSEPHFDIFTEAQGRTVGDSGIREWVGKGYNVLKGDPLGQKSGDPGFANSPFTIEGPSAYTWQTGQKSCRQSIDTSVTKSTKELQSEMAKSIGVDANYATVAFRASSSWGSSFESKSADDAASIFGSTEVHLGTATLKPTTSSELKLCSSFLTAVRTAIETTTDGPLSTILEGFGSHYIKTVSLGGKAQLIYKTSAKAYESAKQSTSNFESSVSASYGLASGQVSGSISNTDSDKIFNLLDSDKKIVFERPPIGVPLQSGVVDCPTYYDKLEQQTSLAPVSFQLVPIENLIDPDRNAFLWKESIEAGDVTREGLDQLAKRFADYVTRCRIGGCAQVSNACNKGFYGSNPMECRSCYAGAGPIGSLGNCHPSQECETISGQCMGQIPQPPKNRDTIAGNEIFTKGETLTSNPAGNCQLRFQSTDGNLVMHRMQANGEYIPGSGGGPTSLNIGGKGGTMLKFSEKGLGNLVVTTNEGNRIWGTKNSYYMGSNTPLPTSSFEAVLQDEDCNFVIYENRAGGSRNSVWSWNTELTSGMWCSACSAV